MTENACSCRRVSRKQAHFFNHGQYLAVEVVCVHSFANWEQLVNMIRNPRGPLIDTLKRFFLARPLNLAAMSSAFTGGFLKLFS